MCRGPLGHWTNESGAQERCEPEVLLWGKGGSQTSEQLNSEWQGSHTFLIAVRASDPTHTFICFPFYFYLICNYLILEDTSPPSGGSEGDYPPPNLPPPSHSLDQSGVSITELQEFQPHLLITKISFLPNGKQSGSFWVSTRPRYGNTDPSLCLSQLVMSSMVSH